jgi:hypothetical protein
MRELHERAVKITAGLWDAYKEFKKQYRLEYKCSRKEYVDICHLINDKLSKKIIRESFEFKMPYRMGTLSVRKSKVRITVKNGRLQKNRMIIDWEKTWNMWYEENPGMTRKQIHAIPNKTVIYNLNEHSNGYVMGWFWDKTTCIVKNKTLYNFRPVKYNRLNLAAWIKSDERENDYFLSKSHRRYDGKRWFKNRIKECIPREEINIEEND